MARPWPVVDAADAAGTVQHLRQRVAHLQDGLARMPVATHPALAGLLQLRTGGSYGVDCASLAMALMAGPSQAGSWAAVIGGDDFGLQAAADFGIDLARLVLVPDPGEHWLEVTAAMVDLATVVVLRPPARVDERAAARIGARLRKRAAVLIAWGPWPRCEVRLSLEQSTWTGVDQGHGRLRTHQVVVSAQRGSAPATRAQLWFPTPAGPQLPTPTPVPTPVPVREVS